MIQIEVIGCTSAGKSTWIKQALLASREQQISIVNSYDFVLNRFGGRWIQNHTLRMLLLNFITLVSCLVSWHQYRALLGFGIGVIRQLPASIGVIGKIKILRIVCRNIGIDKILRQVNSDQQIVIADEGILQIANYLFVHVAIEPNMHDLTEFLRLAPLPDRVLYLQQPVSVLVERVKRRGHHRVPAHIPTATEVFIRHALEVFDQIAQAPVLQGRVTAIDGQKFENSQVNHSHEPSAGEALQTILSVVNQALPDGTTNHNVRGSLDHSIGGLSSESPQSARNTLLSLEK